MNPGWRMLLLQPVYERRNLGSLWGTWLMLAGALLVFLSTGWLTGQWRLGLLLATIVLGAVSFMWWCLLVKSVVAQNRPSHACLVPRLRGRLQWLLVLTFCVAALLLAALGTVQIRHFGYLLALISLLFPLTLLTQRYSWLALLPSVVILSAVSWAKAPLVLALAWVARFDETLVTLAVLGAVAVLSAWALQVAMPHGGDAHADWWRDASRRAQALKRGSFASSLGLAAPSWWTVWQHGRLGATLRHLPVARQLFAGLGVASRGGALAAPLAMLIGILGLVALNLGFHVGIEKIGLAVLQASVLLSVPVHLQRLTAAIAQRSGEQALLRLAPGMPAAGQLNRVLAQALLQRFLMVWLPAAEWLLLLDAYDGGRLALSGYGVLLAVLPLLLAPWLLRDYAAMRRPREPLQAVTELTLLAFMAPVGLRWLVPDGWCWALALLVVVGSALLLRQRWLRMLDAPVAFPAGRLA